MLVKINGSCLHGVEAFRIIVEVSVANGLGYYITGQPDDAVKESLHRIEVAIKSMGFHMPRTKISVNLSPVHIRKTGAGYDLPIAIGILMASNQLADLGKLADFVLVGELGLDGTIYPVRGCLCMAHQAAKDGFRAILVPLANAQEACLSDGIEVYGVSHVKQVLDLIRSDVKMDSMRINGSSWPAGSAVLPDFNEVRGQQNVKRALEIAAAGGHNSLLIGPPGVGKTMLAKRLPSILPPMVKEEILETNRIYSVLDEQEAPAGLITARPFRSPHHTASDVALAGGGSSPLPGEISKAHSGVLFLDELYEFRRSTVEVLRQPLEEGKIRIARAKMALEYPASFMLVAALNPCYCGYYGHAARRCVCSAKSLAFYRRKLSGPLMERIDLHAEVESVPLSELLENRETGESSGVIRERVVRARAIQAVRYRDVVGIYCNARMPEPNMESYCFIERAARKFLLGRMDAMQLSVRAYSRIMKVSRTIADLAGSNMVELSHVAEAIHFRCWDKPVEVGMLSRVQKVISGNDDDRKYGDIGIDLQKKSFFLL